MSGVERFLCRIHHIVNGYRAYYDFYFYLGKQCSIDFNAPVSFACALLDTAAHNVGDRHAGNAQVVHYFLKMLVT